MLCEWSNAKPKHEAKCVLSKGDPLASRTQFLKAISTAAAQAAFCIIDSAETKDAMQFSLEMSPSLKLQMDSNASSLGSQGVPQDLLRISNVTRRSHATGISVGQNYTSPQAHSETFPLYKRQRRRTVSDTSCLLGFPSTRSKEDTKEQRQCPLFNMGYTIGSSKAKREGTFGLGIAVCVA